MPDGVRYVRNELGSIHSVTEEHYQEQLLETSRSGRTYLKPGWSDVDEATARRENPQLFGRPDQNVVRAMTPDEIKQLRERRRFEDELAAETGEG